MYRNAVNGRSPNNNKFSQCSKFDVLSKLIACGRSSFEKRNEDECGNYKIDGDEQCDQGFGVTGTFSKILRLKGLFIHLNVNNLFLCTNVYQVDSMKNFALTGGWL